MKYNVDIVEEVKEELVEEIVDEETTDNILKVVKSMDKSHCPFFNGLTFDEVVNDKMNPLTIKFQSSYDDLDYTIYLKVDGDKIILEEYDDLFRCVFSGKEGSILFRYNSDVILVEKIKKKVAFDDEERYIDISIYSDVDDINLIDELKPDFHHNQKTSTVGFRPEWDASIFYELGDFDVLLRLGIDYDKSCREQYLDFFEPIVNPKSK